MKYELTIHAYDPDEIIVMDDSTGCVETTGHDLCPFCDSRWEWSPISDTPPCEHAMSINGEGVWCGDLDDTIDAIDVAGRQIHFATREIRRRFWYLVGAQAWARHGRDAEYTPNLPPSKRDGEAWLDGWRGERAEQASRMYTQIEMGVTLFAVAYFGFQIIRGL